MVYDTAQQQSLLQNLSSPYANKIERMEKGAVQSSSPQVTTALFFFYQKKTKKKTDGLLS